MLEKLCGRSLLQAAQFSSFALCAALLGRMRRRGCCRIVHGPGFNGGRDVGYEQRFIIRKRPRKAFGSFPQSILADAPAAFYRLDEASGTIAHDLATGGINGTYAGNFALGTGSFLPADTDAATTLNGGYVHVPVDPAAQPTAALTIEAWIDPSYGAASAQEAKIVSNSRDWTSPYDTYKLSIVYGHPTFRLVLNGSAVVLTATASVAPNTPAHLVASYDGHAMRIFLNGRIVAVNSVAGSISNYSSDGMGIGASNTGTWAFRGEIADVAIYPYALSLNRILVHEAAAGTATAYDGSILAAGPVGYYRLNETVGSIAYDASVTKQNGTYTSSMQTGAPGMIGISDASTNFSSGALQLGRSSAQFPSNAVTVEAVISPTSAAIRASEAKILSSGVPWSLPYDSYKLSLVAGKPSMQVAVNGNYVQVIAPTAVTAGSVYHIAGEYDGTNLSVFVNGQLANTKTASGSIFGGGGAGVAIGADIASNWPFSGRPPRHRGLCRRRFRGNACGSRTARPATRILRAHGAGSGRSAHADAHGKLRYQRECDHRSERHRVEHVRRPAPRCRLADYRHRR